MKTSLYFKFSLSFDSTYSYPSHYIEFIFWDLPPATFSPYALNDQIPCQLSSGFTSITNREDPTCVLTEANNVLGYVKVRIINFGPLVIGNYWVTFDDITLPSPTGSDNTQKFDMSIRYMGPSNVKQESLFREVFLIDQTNTTSGTALSVSFNTPSVTQYGTDISGSLALSWPLDSRSLGTESKLAINFYSGYASIWDSIDDVTFVDETGTYQLLWVNKKLNKFVFAIPRKDISTTTTINITALSNPYPFQKADYENSGARPTMEINFYENYYHRSYNTTFYQPDFSTFTKTIAPIVNMDQNLPSNSFDTYPSTNKIPNGGDTILRLGVVID